MYRLFVLDDRGAVTTDWVALTAGIIVLGLVVAHSVLGDSHVYLEKTFEDLNEQLDKQNEALARLEGGIDINGK